MLNNILMDSYGKYDQTVARTNSPTGPGRWAIFSRPGIAGAASFWFQDGRCCGLQAGLENARCFIGLEELACADV